ncbi:sirohydrochlorin chelatase [Streptacidiphilus sp. EB129]|uniref:sirohydrochlorin chelatase n=1 Tax=Streptacidiphilus sp. EB129 TaxID=3156262 RepID=UPI0035135EC2
MSAAVVLVGGHESADGRNLRAWADEGRAVAAGQPLVRAVEEALAGPGPVCVVPMSLGRDPHLLADTARTLAWLARSVPPGRIALADPFGTTEHLIGYLRAAAVRNSAADSTALLLTGPAADRDADAELFRIARLVYQYGRHRWVEVAFDGGDPEPGQGVDRCRRLGARRVVAVPATFAPAAVPGAEDGGPLLSGPAVAGVIRARTRDALHRLGHGTDGIADALHRYGDAHGHTHGPSHDPSHSHP